MTLRTLEQTLFHRTHPSTAAPMPSKVRMKLRSIYVLFASLVSSQLVAPLRRDEHAQPAAQVGHVSDHGTQQRPLAMDPVGPALPPDSGLPDGAQEPDYGMPEPGGPGEGSVMLSDVMGRDRSINIFAGFTRDIESVSRRLDDADMNTTVLAPLNSAIVALPRKPWEDPDDYDEHGPGAYDGQDGQDRAHANLARFTEAHIVPASPWKERQKIRPLADGDIEVWWEVKDGKKLVRRDSAVD